jgi:signal peptidase II
LKIGYNVGRENRRFVLKRSIRDYIFLLVIAGTVVLLDQLSKAYIRNNLQLNEIWMPWVWLAPYARIVHWYNTGVAFGMFQGQGQIFGIINTIVAIAILYYFPRVPREDWALRTAMGLQLGGAVGNLIDRLTVGHVTDFISVGSFPVFNLADASITIGVGVLLLGMWIQEQRKKTDPDEVVTDPNPHAEGSDGHLE